MRISSVEAIAVEVPLDKVFSGSGYRVNTRCTVITRIRTEDGRVSEVFNGDNRSGGRALVRLIEDRLAPLVVGLEAFAVEEAWRRMFETTVPHGDRHLLMQAIACVDTAMWDLIGKGLGVNVGRLLGGFRDTIPIIAIAGYYEAGKTLDDLTREMDWLRSVGMAGCKMKVGGLGPAEDAERVAAAKRGGGEGFVLAVDANCGWTAPDALEFARRIEPLGIAWFEEPCHWYDDVAGMLEVRRGVSIPITAGQSEISGFAVRRLVEARAVDLVNFDASEAGGITEWRRVAGLCALAGVSMAHHEEPQIAMQMLSAVAHGTYVECFPDPVRDPVWARMIRNRPDPQDGVIAVPQGPGFGLELDWDMIERHRLR